ncbi:Tensin [Nymphon striatum]|nr:Tensin [Nymphon striatum]
METASRLIFGISPLIPRDFELQDFCFGAFEFILHQLPFKALIQTNGVVLNGTANGIPGVPLRNHNHIEHIKERPLSLDMDLTYITERIIALTYTAAPNDAAYRSSINEMSKMLKVKHIDKYMILNLSPKRHDISKLNKQVMDFGWPASIAPELEKLCSICKAIESWLSMDPQHIIVIHSRNDKGRTGVVVSAYMHYTNLCASSDQALDRFSMKRFYDHKLAPYTQPSQKRYARYFSGLLSGAIKMNNNPLYLHHIILHGVLEIDNKGFRPFIKIFQGLKCVFTSGVYHVADKMKRLVISLDKALALRGDILVKCYHKKVGPPARVAVFRVQFHTCAINDEILSFNKSELDEACDDVRFSHDCRVEFQFSFTQDQYRTLGTINDAMVPVDFSQDSIVRCNSYEHFDFNPEDNPNDIEDTTDTDESFHTKGPVDGNLYAQVSKKQMNGFIPNQLILNDGSHTASMDSGISSNPGNHGSQSCNTTPNSVITHANTNGHSKAIETEVEVHKPPEKNETKITAITASIPSSGNHDMDHNKLDALINDMMLDIQSMPDVTKPEVTAYTYTVSHAIESTSPSVNQPQPFKDYKIGNTNLNKKCVHFELVLIKDILTLPHKKSSSYIRMLDQIFGLGTSNIKLHTNTNKIRLEKGVRQGDSISPKLFTACLENVFRCLNWTSKGIPINGDRLTNLRFADDVVLFSESPQELQLMVEELRTASSKVGLEINLIGRTVNHTRNEVDGNKPHHARSQSTPFSYGDVTKSSVMPMRQVSIEEKNLLNEETRSASPEKIRSVSPEKIRSVSPEKTRSMSPSISDPGHSWLEKQQLKLRDRRDGRGTLDRRYKESRMLAELQENQMNLQNQINNKTIEESVIFQQNEGGSIYNTYSGRTSSSPAAKPPLGLSAPSSPLIPNRSSSKNVTKYSYPQSYTVHVSSSSSRPLTRQKSDTSFDRERPFVSQKKSQTLDRSYEPYSQFVTSSPYPASNDSYNHLNMYSDNTEKELSPIRIDTDTSSAPITNGHGSHPLEGINSSGQGTFL